MYVVDEFIVAQWCIFPQIDFEVSCHATVAERHFRRMSKVVSGELGARSISFGFWCFLKTWEAKKDAQSQKYLIIIYNRKSKLLNFLNAFL